MMKTAKLFIDGSEYCDIEYSNDRYFGHCVYLILQNEFDLSEYNDGGSFEWHTENESGDVLNSGVATVNFNQILTIKVDDD